MASRKVTVTVKYSNPGTQPPIYLAGSFSVPEWQPEEMQYTTDKNNEHEFHKQVEVEQGKEYQYKFRVGSGEWWTLDEAAPTVTDDLGNKNNLLSIPKVEETTTNLEESTSIQKQEEAQAEIESTPTMEKETTPSIEETMGTRETDDALFADEIIPDTNGGTQELGANTTEGAVESHATSTTDEKPETEHAEAHHIKELQEMRGSNAKQKSVARAVEGITEPHATPALVEKSKYDHVEEGKHTEDQQETRGTDALVSKLEEKHVIEPIPKPLMDFKRIHDLEDLDSQNVSDDEVQEDKAVAPPTLVIEEAEQGEGDKAGDSQDLLVEDLDVETEQDDFSPEATNHDHESSDLLTAKIAAEHATIARTPTPEIANVAAEVADVAATLDREQPTPPVSDDEAGRIGYRRMSLTPIPQVALIAAEVADSAALIDKEDDDTEDFKEPVEFIRPFDIDDGPLPDTPPNERVPKFSHECGSPPDHESPCRHDEINPYAGMAPEAHEEPDLDDPNIKMFPTDRAEIMEHLRRMQQRLPADEVKLDLAPPSPVIVPNGRSDRLNLPGVSPVVLAQRDPSLDSIPEQLDEEGGVLKPSIIKLNSEDQPHSTGVTISKDKIDAIVGKSGMENTGPLAELESKPRDLVSSMDVVEEGANNVGPDEAKNTNTHLSSAIVPVDDSSAQAPKPSKEQDADITQSTGADTKTRSEESQKMSSPEDRNAEPAAWSEESTGKEELKLPAISIEDSAAKYETRKSMDGVCDRDGHTVHSSITPLIVGDRQLGQEDENIQKLSTGTGPSITLQPATPGPGINRQFSDEDGLAQNSSHTDTSQSLAESTIAPDSSTMTDTTIGHNEQAKSTAIETEEGQSQVKPRNRQSSPSNAVKRPITPNSVRSNGKDPKDLKSGNLFRTILRVVFVEWIGGFFMRLCGGRRRHQILVVVAMIALLPTLYYFDMIPATFMESLQRLHIPIR